MRCPIAAHRFFPAGGDSGECFTRGSAFGGGSGSHSLEGLREFGARRMCRQDACFTADLPSDIGIGSEETG